MADISGLLKTISQELRKAQNAFFNGKFHEALALADGVAATIESAKLQDPENVQLKSHGNQLAKLRKDVASRSGKPAASAPPPPAAPAAPAAEKAPPPPAAPAAPQAAAEAEEQRRLALRSQCEEWEARLRAFAPHGAAPFGHNTESVPDLLAQAEAYAQALPVWEAFQKGEFPFGKTEGLAELERGLARGFEAFPAFLERTKAARFDDTLAYLRSRLDALGRDVEGGPDIMSAGSMKEAEERLAQAQPLLADDASRWPTLLGALDQVKARNAANRAAQAKATFIRPDAYKGDDAPQIKERAERFIRAAEPAAQIVKSAVYGDDWKELSQWEDYAGTPRFVTRREIYAQVAARVSDGCRLFTIYITKELRSDQTWSALAGNVMHADEMDPSNLGQ